MKISMKTLIANCAYSDLPRLIKEGVVKVGTKVRACELKPNWFNATMPKGKIGEIKFIYDSGFTIYCENRIGCTCYDFNWFLDILSDEEEESEKCMVEVPTIDEDGTEKNSDYSTACLQPRPCPHNDKDIEIGEKECICHPNENGNIMCTFCSELLKLQEPSKTLSFDEPLTKEAVGRVIYHKYIAKAEIINISIDGMYALLEWHEACREWRSITMLKAEQWSFGEPEEITIEQAEKLTGKKIKR